MFEFIQGILEEKSPEFAVINAHGVGYLMHIPISCYSKLPAVGEQTRLYTSFIVREDAHRLFGFLDRAERDTFNVLKEISGIGPKTALALIGHLDRHRLHEAVHSQNVALISKVPGIGKKTAERLIVELRDKKMKSPLIEMNQNVSLSEGEQLRFDAISALANLGFTTMQAEKAVDKALKETKEALQLPTLITKALQGI